ncbi:deoxyribonuclease-1 [Tamilnaduibacter salinus]|uniref:Deoxyribonuclease-1 n=1 Tax=Tamilnaduibacter salinus TaxID=1484056 RepID=A0A2U1CUJ5_9GAMM|nr:endonuclease [Tamilnaduibacter salinus]PVY70729.1 deoxyribonuclease-1 [Tamilnaduibacter salinus]
MTKTTTTSFFTRLIALVSGAALTASVLFILPGHAQNRFSNPEKTVEDIFWGKLYKQGGNTFFCNKQFGQDSFLITQGYIYPLNRVRDALRCGTKSQCERNSEVYRHVASDLHNMVPIKSRIEMKRRNAGYGEMTSTAPKGECGLKEGFQNIEPPDRIKGDVARGVVYVMDTYDLPAPGSNDVFKRWHQADPPGDLELTRNHRIRELQGNDNRFITNPDAMFDDSIWGDAS